MCQPDHTVRALHMLFDLKGTTLFTSSLNHFLAAHKNIHTHTMHCNGVPAFTIFASEMIHKLTCGAAEEAGNSSTQVCYATV